MLTNSRLLTQSSVRAAISRGIQRAQFTSQLTDADFAASIGASAGSVGNWRNQTHDMGPVHLSNAMIRHPQFAIEYLAVLGLKPQPLTPEDIEARRFATDLAGLQFKVARALEDGDVTHQELLDMEPEIEAVDRQTYNFKAKIRKFRTAA